MCAPGPTGHQGGACAGSIWVIQGWARANLGAYTAVKWGNNVCLKKLFTTHLGYLIAFFTPFLSPFLALFAFLQKPKLENGSVWDESWGNNCSRTGFLHAPVAQSGPFQEHVMQIYNFP